MGEIRRPEDLVQRREKPVSDLTPGVMPWPGSPSLNEVMQEIRSLKTEIAKIKRALRVHGIAIE